MKFASKGYPQKFVSDENLKFYNTDNKTLLRQKIEKMLDGNILTDKEVRHLITKLKQNDK